MALVDVRSIRRRAQLNFYAYIPETDMTKPSDLDVHPIDPLVAEIFDTPPKTGKKFFSKERPSSNLIQIYPELMRSVWP
jgi:hypothetical protein